MIIVYFLTAISVRIIRLCFCRTCFSMVGYRRPVFRPSVPQSVSQFTIYVDPSSLVHCMTYSLKPLHPWFSNFTYYMTGLKGFRMIKFSLVENPRWPPILKIDKSIWYIRLKIFIEQEGPICSKITKWKNKSILE